MGTVSAAAITRIHDVEGALTLVSVGSGGAGSANTDIFIQATQSAGRRRSSVTLEGFLLTDAADNDLSAADIHVGLWVWVTHYASLTALRIRIAETTTTNYDEHIVPLTEYANLGGWLRVWLDISRTPDATGTGGLNEALARNFGPIVSLPTVGGTSQNVILDAVDHTTTGLSMTGTAGLWSDFVTADEGTVNNKYGVVMTVSGVIYCKARLILGTASSLVFDDSNFTIVFPQQNLVTDTFMGISIDLQHASTNIDWAAGSIQSPGVKKGDIVVTGTSGTFDVTGCSLVGLRIVTLTSKCTISTTTFQTCGLVAQAGAQLTSCTFNKPSGTIGITVDDLSKIDLCAFTSDGTGHAIELRPTGAGPFEFDLNGCTFSSYASVDGSTGNEVMLINPVTTSANITVNVVGGSNTPTIMLAAGYTGTFTLVVNPVATTLTVKNIDTGAVIESARVLVTASDGTGPMPFEKTTTITRSGSVATASCTAHGLVNGKKAVIKGADQFEYNGVFVITFIDTNSFSYTVSGSPATPATGTIKTTGVVIDAATNASGVVSDTRSHASNQPIVGRVRKATGGTLYKTGVVSGTISSTTGFSATVQLIPDQ